MNKTYIASMYFLHFMFFSITAIHASEEQPPRKNLFSYITCCILHKKNTNVCSAAPHEKQPEIQQTDIGISIIEQKTMILQDQYSSSQEKDFANPIIKMTCPCSTEKEDKIYAEKKLKADTLTTLSSQNIHLPLNAPIENQTNDQPELRLPSISKDQYDRLSINNQKLYKPIKIKTILKHKEIRKFTIYYNTKLYDQIGRSDEKNNFFIQNSPKE